MDLGSDSDSEEVLPLDDESPQTLPLLKKNKNEETNVTTNINVAKKIPKKTSTNSPRLPEAPFYACVRTGTNTSLCCFYSTDGSTLSLAWKQPLDLPKGGFYEGYVNVWACQIYLNDQGQIIVGYGNSLSAFTEKGELVWKFTKDDTFQMLLSFENIYVVAWKKTVCSYSQAGTEGWENDLEGECGALHILSSIAMCNEQLMCFNSEYLWALNPFTGRKIFWKTKLLEWKYFGSAAVHSSILVDPEKYIVHVCCRGVFFSLDSRSGVIIRQTPLYTEGQTPAAFPRIARFSHFAHEAIVIAADQTIYCIHAGAHDYIWKADISAKIAPLLHHLTFSGSCVYLGFQGKVYIFNAHVESSKLRSITLKEHATEEWNPLQNGHVSLFQRNGLIYAGMEGKIAIIDKNTFELVEEFDFTQELGEGTFAFPGFQEERQATPVVWLHSGKKK